MKSSGGKGQCVFGAFRFDLQNRELTKLGVRLRVEDKPAQVLASLLDCAGEVVSREELQNLLWPDGVHVDYDHGLNKAINKLRTILGDDASKPRYIETLSRRGYRFIGEVERILDPAKPDEENVSVGPAPKLVCAPARRSLLNVPSIYMRAALLCVVLLVLAVVALAFFRGQFQIFAQAQSNIVRPRKSVAIFEFENLSKQKEDDWLAVAIAEWLNSELSSGEELRVIPQSTISRVRREMGLEPPELSRAEVRERLRHSLGADLLISGTYALIGNEPGRQVRMDVRIHDLQTGENLNAAFITLPKLELLQASSRLAARIRSVLGERPLAEEDLAEVRSTVSDNPEAARWYAVGLEKLRVSDAIAAAECFQKVVALDANYSLGHARLATAWSRLGYAAKAKAEAEKAFLRSQSLPRKDKLLIEAQYRESIYAWDEAIALYNELFHSYPDSLEYGLRLAEAQAAASHGVDALETVRQLRKLPSPASSDARLDLAEADAAASLSDFRLQLQAADAAYKKGTDDGAHLLVARSQTIRGDALRALGKPGEALAAWEQAQEIFSRAGDQGGITNVLNSRGLLLFRMTQIEQARRTYQQSMEICRRLGDQACLARAMAGLGVVESYYGDETVARNLLDRALAIYGEIGNLQEEAYTLSLIADMTLPDYAKAKPMYERSLELSRQANDRSRIAGRLMDLAIMHMVEGDLASAHKMLEEAASVHHSLGEKYREAACLHREGEVAAWQGDLPLAQDLTSRALAIREQLDEPEYVAQTLDTIAWIELQSGNLKAAEETAAKAMAEHDRAHGPIGVGIANEVMSEALLAEGRLSEAEAAFARAQELMSPWKTGEAPVSLKVLKARLLAAHGRTSEAHREFRQAIELAKKYHTGRVLMLASFSKAELDFGLHLESSAEELRRFELEAEAKGFGLFAEQARASLALSFPTTARNSR